MRPVRYNSTPPVLRNNPWIFAGCVAALVGAGALSVEMPEIVLLVVILCIPLWLFLFVKSKVHRLMITDEEVIYEKGLLSKSRTEIGLKSVRAMRLNQSFLQRMLGIASVEFFSAGDVAEIVVWGMPNPHRIRELVER
ncbi:PH domain-containing protein [Aliiroseovarius subalbicans]|uniref:PH domain-containing protein n=1 Tax=Aliiroseovarius subalbicans TaxID=2925840 RepID=UPI001F57BF74|nr:PH domain-containing protein [Aliiroseovarius subalbicans]MCI2399855.1 PH domain-containing protein [Aliiroseovarius subalbicans]